MKKILAILLLVCMVLTLCACGSQEEGNNNETQAAPAGSQQGNAQGNNGDSQGSNENAETTAPLATEPQVTVPVETEPVQPGPTYVIKVVDEGGNPVPGMFVQLCGDMCIPKMTDENGEAIYENQELRNDYKGSVTVYKEGYEAASEQTDYYFEDGFEVTIVVKAVA